MKNILKFPTRFCLFLLVLLMAGTTIKAQQKKEDQKLEWFRDAKLGLFMHWGPSSVKGVEISWARQDHAFDHPGKGEKVPNDVYDNLYKSFNPVKFDAE